MKVPDSSRNAERLRLLAEVRARLGALRRDDRVRKVLDSHAATAEELRKAAARRRHVS